MLAVRLTKLVRYLQHFLRRQKDVPTFLCKFPDMLMVTLKLWSYDLHLLALVLCLCIFSKSMLMFLLYLFCLNRLKEKRCSGNMIKFEVGKPNSTAWGPIAKQISFLWQNVVKRNTCLEPKLKHALFVILLL